MITLTQRYLLGKLPLAMQQRILVSANGCWLWKFNLNRNGYGRYYANGKRVMAHIHTYKLLKGEYAEGLVLDHVECSVRNCCNPTHLSPVTVGQNTHRGNAILYTKKRR